MKRTGLLFLTLIAVVGLAAAGCGAPATVPPPPPEPAVTEAPADTPAPPTEAPAAFDGQALLQDRCTQCHNLDRVSAASKTEAQWKVSIDRMVAKGAKLTPEEVQALAQFLASQ